MRDRWNERKSGNCELYPGSDKDCENDNSDANQNGRSYPDSKAAVRRIVNGGMCSIERDHR